MVLARGYYLEENLPHSEIARRINTVVRTLVTDHLAGMLEIGYLVWIALKSNRSKMAGSLGAEVLCNAFVLA